MNAHVALHISLIPGIGPAAYECVSAWMQKNHAMPEDIYRCSLHDIQAMGLRVEQATKLYEGLAHRALLNTELALLQKHQVNVLIAGDIAYPALLAAIHQPPIVLYVQGSLAALANPALAIIGSRKANAYGKAVVDLLVPPLVAEGYTIVSGGARGIDAYAHQKTIAMGGTTIAVLGSGLLRLYPEEHASLFAEIGTTGGALVSPYPLTTSALAGHFPARNRIIAGLARASLIVQAAARSGALITASYALQEGRDVGVVPGSIFDPLSSGCHKLLAEGATPICSADDVWALLGHEQKKYISTEVSPQVCPELSPAKQVHDACFVPHSFDDLLTLTKVTAEILHEIVWQLQIEGKIEQTITGLWKTIR